MTSPIVRLLWVCFGWMAWTSAALGQSPSQPYELESIQIGLQKIQKIVANLDGSESLETLKLAIDMQPEDRHRLMLPQPSASSKLAVAAMAKLFPDKGALSEIRNSLEVLASGLDQAAGLAESQRDWSTGYRMRWQAAGVRAILPAPGAQGAGNRKGAGSSAWSHSSAVGDVQLVARAFVNHPKMLWPAGSYALAVTPHFEIASQAGNKPTAELADLCEQSFAVWKQMFFSYWASEQTTAPEYKWTSDHKFSVVLFRDKKAYIDALKNAEKNIAISTGYYDPNRKLAMFYWEGDKTATTVVHELMHQFFYEACSRPVDFDTDAGSDFWVAEGIALYLESMSTRACGGAAVVDVGGWDAPRLQAARFRALHNQNWVPWDRYRTQSGKDFRNSADVREWYTQASGLAHLWMDGEREQREAFIKYLESVYMGKPDPSLLGQLNRDASLHGQYAEFLKNVPVHKAVRPFFSNRRDTVLTTCQVNSQQLLDWPTGYRSQNWLDLSFTEVDDSLFMAEDKVQSPAWNASRLSLESTQVTDKSLTAIGGMKDLSELDLSQCKITDDGLESLRGNKTIKMLWLSQTGITDAAIDVLSTFKQLEFLDIKGTQVTQNRWEKLMQERPRLKRNSIGP